MQTVYILQGVAGAGKSTFVKLLESLQDCYVLSYDRLRELKCIQKNGEGWNQAAHDIVEWQWQNSIVNIVRHNSCNIVLDDTHTSKHNLFRSVAQVAAGAIKANKKVEIVVVRLDTPLEVCEEHRKDFDDGVLRRHQENMKYWNCKDLYPTLVKRVLSYNRGVINEFTKAP